MEKIRIRFKWQRGVAILGICGLIASGRFASADALSEARALYKQGQYAQAANKYAEAAKEHPTDPSIFWNQGFAYRKLKRYSEALGSFEKAGKLDPTHSFASKPGKYEEMLASTRKLAGKKAPKLKPAHGAKSSGSSPASLPEVATLKKSSVYVQEPNWSNANVSYMNTLADELSGKSSAKPAVKFLIVSSEYRGGQLLRYAATVHKMLGLGKGYLFVASREGAVCVTDSSKPDELKAAYSKVGKTVRSGDAARALEKLAREIVK